jgi:hypothetical protein
MLSNIIVALMQLSQCLLDKLENMRSNVVGPTGSSWQISPANMSENPPEGLALFPISLSFTSSVQGFNHSWMILYQQ